MKKINGAFLTVSIFSTILLSAEIFAVQEENKQEESNFSVKLQSLEKIQSQEKSGDELYISVTEFPSKGNPRHYQVPNFPTHWLSSYLKNIKDVPLWSVSKETGCMDGKVIFSLVEEDIPPWNLDDLLGSVVLNVKCENGTQQYEWSIPNAANTQKLEDSGNGFTFNGDNSKYKAFFTVGKP